jgi:hypothetical protein
MLATTIKTNAMPDRKVILLPQVFTALALYRLQV